MKQLLPVLMTIAASIPGMAQEPEVMNGNVNLISKEYDSLSINGGLTFENLSIKNLLIINGRIQGKNLQCTIINSNGSLNVTGLQAQNIESHGTFLAKDIDVTGESILRGTIEITNAKLNQIKMSTTQTTFTNAEVRGNVILENIDKASDHLGGSFPQPQPQVLKLKGKSLILGDIIFENKGEVHVFDQARIEGKVINATVVRKAHNLPDEQ
jgi:hypothetical protein